MSLKRYYTLVEANRAIEEIEPLVRALSERAGLLSGLHTPQRGPEHRRPAVDSRVDPVYFRELLALTRDIQELSRHGCLVKDLRGGVVDFPTRLEGREVYLCWMLGEETISHWHEADAGFRGRKPIEQGLKFEGEKAGGD